ncbi:MAG: hypothetical protein OEY75_12990, partial [Hylemonella sp.]|nr:hypothetical protein [Hylemonella sp.]
PPATALALDGFVVNVVCSSQVYVESAANRTLFRVTAVASSAGTAGSTGYVERSVSAILEL